MKPAILYFHFTVGNLSSVQLVQYIPCVKSNHRLFWLHNLLRYMQSNSVATISLEDEPGIVYHTKVVGVRVTT